MKCVYCKEQNICVDKQLYPALSGCSSGIALHKCPLCGGKVEIIKHTDSVPRLAIHCPECKLILPADLPYESEKTSTDDIIRKWKRLAG